MSNAQEHLEKAIKINPEFADAYVMNLSTTLPDETPPYLQICARWSNSGQQGDWITTSPIKTPFQGKVITSWGSQGYGDNQLFQPNSLATDNGNNIYVTDQIPRLSMLSSDGVLIGRCRPVRFGAHGIGGDASGNLYLAETAPLDCLTRLRLLDK